MTAAKSEAVKARPDLSGLTDRLVSHVHALVGEPLPLDVSETARHCLLDWIAIALAGAKEPLVEMLLAELAGQGGSSACTVVGRATRAPMLTAAAVNAAAADALDFSDGNLAMRGHTTPAVIATALALAEERDSSGSELIRAIVAGIEAECRIGLMVNPPHLRKGFHPTGSMATFGAAAAASYLLELSAEQTGMALGIAATQAAGLLASGGTMAKPFHSGKAAFNGLLAARLAQRGFVGRADAIEAPDGFLETHADGIRDGVERFDDGRYMILGTIFKSHAACQLTHSTIDNILTLMSEYGAAANDIDHIELQVPPGYLSVCNIQTPTTGLEAKFSLRGVVAMTLLGDDTRDIAAYADERIRRPELAALCERVTVTPRPDYAGGLSTAMTTLRHGQTIVLTCDSYRPASDIAAQRQAVTRKFHLLARAAVGEARMHQIEMAVAQIDQAKSVRSLIEMFGA
jgi:2-methylcitrate dehydratase PrpD